MLSESNVAALFKKKKRKKRTFIPKLKKMMTPAAVAAGIRQSIVATIFTRWRGSVGRRGSGGRRNERREASAT
jgi:hypothetical protein